MLAAIVLFWSRDCFVLQIGPPRTIARRVFIYCSTVLIIAVAGWILVANSTTDQLQRFRHSRQLLVVLICSQLIGAGTCLWIRNTRRYCDAWLVALLPAPGSWLLIESTLPLPAYDWHFFQSSFILGVALWIASTTLIVLRCGRNKMPIEVMDFAISAAGLSNCL